MTHPQIQSPLSPLPAAVLFDMDGLLIDTEPIWFAEETELITAHGASWEPDDHHVLVGSSMATASVFIARRIGPAVTAQQVSDELLVRMRTRLRNAPALQPGVVALINELDRAGVPRALVSSSFRVLVDAALAGLAPLAFDTVVVGDEVSHSKPHPEPYLMGARKLGVDPARCVALEDSPHGVVSALAAGCFVIAVPSVAPIEPAERCVVVASVASVNLSYLRDLVCSPGSA